MSVTATMASVMVRPPAFGGSGVRMPFSAFAAYSRSAPASSVRRSASAMRSGSAIAAASAAEASASVSAGRSSASEDDIDASFALDHFVAFEPELWVRRTFAGLELVLPAMPGADDMRFALVVGLAEEALVRAEQIHHFIPDDALAGRSALVQALIAVGVQGSGVAVDPDLDPVLADDADIAILHLKFAADKDLRHPLFAP